MTKKLFYLTTSLLLCLFLAFNGHAGRIEYTYDELSRLTDAVSSDGLSIKYTLDKTGNRLTRIVSNSNIDTDADSLPDILEKNSCTDWLDVDSDDDGIADGVEDANHNGVVDPGETDPCNIDSDGDGIQDGTEMGITTPIADPDGAGRLKGTDTAIFQPDLDPQTTTDPLAADSDGDGLIDGTEDANRNGRIDSGEYDPLLLAPVISQLVPRVSPVGSTVTITGTRFQDNQGSGYVVFHPQVEADNILLWSNTEIQCVVPNGFEVGCLRVVTTGGPSNCIIFGKEKLRMVLPHLYYLILKD